jgi:hypothetical protein
MKELCDEEWRGTTATSAGGLQRSDVTAELGRPFGERIDQRTGPLG